VSQTNQEGSSDQRTGSAAEGKREVRWSARRKEEVVMRLLRGESLDALARECKQPAGQISSWREEFLTAGREGLKARPRAPEERELTEAQRKIGAQAIEIDSLKALLAKKGAPQSKRRSR
jgi:hypothetical protein